MLIFLNMSLFHGTLRVVVSPFLNGRMKKEGTGKEGVGREIQETACQYFLSFLKESFYYLSENGYII